MNYPYSNGIVKSLENKLINREKIMRLTKVSKDDFVKALLEMDYGSSNCLTFEEVIYEEMSKIKKTIDSITPNKDYSDLFYLDQDCLNVKILYKHLLFGINYDNILSNLGSFSIEQIKKIILDKDYSELTKKEIKLFKDLDNLVKGLSSKDLSIMVDKMFYEYAVDLVKGNTILLTYYKALIDITNLLTLIRCKLLNWNQDEFKKMIISNGTIISSKLEQLYLVDENTFLKEIKGFYQEKLTKIFKKYFVNRSVSNLESDLNQFVLEIVKENSNDAFNIGPLLYYYLAKKSEINNIRLVYANPKIAVNELLWY